MKYVTASVCGGGMKHIKCRGRYEELRAAEMSFILYKNINFKLFMLNIVK